MRLLRVPTIERSPPPNPFRSQQQRLDTPAKCVQVSWVSSTELTSGGVSPSNQPRRRSFSYPGLTRFTSPDWGVVITLLFPPMNTGSGRTWTPPVGGGREILRLCFTFSSSAQTWRGTRVQQTSHQLGTYGSSLHPPSVSWGRWGSCRHTLHYRYREERSRHPRRAPSPLGRRGLYYYYHWKGSDIVKKLSTTHVVRCIWLSTEMLSGMTNSAYYFYYYFTKLPKSGGDFEFCKTFYQASQDNMP